MNLSERITEQRRIKGWSQEELAYRLGVSRQAVSGHSFHFLMLDIMK